MRGRRVNQRVEKRTKAEKTQEVFLNTREEERVEEEEEDGGGKRAGP